MEINSSKKDLTQKTPACFCIITHNFVPLQAKNKIKIDCIE